MGCNPLKCRCGRYYLPQRIILAFLLHILLQNNFNTRVVLNVAIVEMVDPVPEETPEEIACPQFGPYNDSSTREDGGFRWKSKTKSLVLYAFYIGYTLTQVPGGWLADKYGARYVILFCVATTSLITGLFPIMTIKLGHFAAVGLRFLLGVSHGVVYPSISSMISTWFPREEQPRWGGICFAGANLGIILSNVVSGVLIYTYKTWTVAFYFWAAYSTIYLFLVLLLLYSFPDTHPFITEEEANYIRFHHTNNISVVGRSLRTPWKKILLNGPFWANITAQFGTNYICLTIITYLPTYLKEILQFSVKENGYFSSLGFLVSWLMTLFLSAVAPHFYKCMSVLTFFKVFGAAGTNVGCAALLLGAIYAGCNRTLCITLYVLSMAMMAFYNVTLAVNISFLSKNYAGLMFGLCNAIGSVSGIIGNALLGSITKTKQIRDWKIAFWITFGVAVFTTVIFFIFGSAERQPFDYGDSEEKPP